MEVPVPTSKRLTSWKLFNSTKNKSKKEQSSLMNGEPQFLTCTLCDVKCSGQISYQQHLSGKPHLKKVKLESGSDAANALPKPVQRPDAVQRNDYFCTTCKVTMTGPEAYVSHMKGLQHERRLKLAQLDKNNDFPPPKTEVDPDSTSNKLCCQVCNVSMTGPESWQLHLSGKLHAKKKQLIAVNETISEEPLFISKKIPKLLKSDFFCEVCQVSMTGREVFDLHVIGRKHKRKLMLQKMIVNEGNLCVKKPKLDEKTIENDNSSCAKEPTLASSKYRYFCDLCNVKEYEPIGYEDHLKSSQHLNNSTAFKTAFLGVTEIPANVDVTSVLLDVFAEGSKSSTVVEDDD